MSCKILVGLRARGLRVWVLGLGLGNTEMNTCIVTDRRIEGSPKWVLLGGYIDTCIPACIYIYVYICVRVWKKGSTGGICIDMSV